eukprot:scaffold36300_cov123-Isochrysis_galbana.AAC.7
MRERRGAGRARGATGQPPLGRATTGRTLTEQQQQKAHALVATKTHIANTDTSLIRPALALIVPVHDLHDGRFIK